MTVVLDDGKLDQKWVDGWAKRCFVGIPISDGTHEAAFVRRAQQIERYAGGIERRFQELYPEPTEAFEIEFRRWFAAEIEGYRLHLAEMERGYLRTRPHQ